MNPKFTVIPMTENNVRQVADIEAECFTSPWSYESFLSELSNPVSRTWVAMDDEGNAVGFLNAYFVLDEASLNNLAVREPYRGQGVGHLLMQTAIQYCRKNGVASFTLEVRKSNQAALSLYEKLGFRKTGERKGFYTQPDEDACLMTKRFQ